LRIADLAACNRYGLLDPSSFGLFFISNCQFPIADFLLTAKLAPNRQLAIDNA
jgi:hypothetical protein